MLRKCILISLFTAFIHPSFGQDKEKVTEPDSLSSIGLIGLAERNRASNAFAAAVYAEKAIREGLRHNNAHAVIRGNLLLGRLQEEKNKTAEAYKYYQEAIKKALEINDSSLISVSYQSIGVIYKRLELFPKAVEYEWKALKYSEPNNANKRQTIICCNILGHVYMDWFLQTNLRVNFDSAISNYNRALRKSDTVQLKEFMNSGHVNLANAYMMYYKTFGGAKMIRRSIRMSYAGLNYSKEQKHPDWMPIHYLNLGEAYHYWGYNDSAIIYYKKSFQLNKEFDNVVWFEAVNRDIALAYKAKGDYDNAIKYIQEAIRDGHKYHASASAENYRILSELLDFKKNYVGALEAFKKYKELENEDINLKRTLNLERMQVEYEMGRKDKEIDYLNQKKSIAEERLSKGRLVILLVIISLVLVAMVCVVLIIRSRNLKRSKELSDAARMMQEQFLANTSHEIRTPMNGIQGMVNLLLQSPTTETQKQQLEIIKSSSNHLLRIINDLLDLSKIKAGKIEFVSNSFNIEQLVNLIIELMQPMAENKGLELEMKISESIKGYYEGDDIRLEQILINVLSNAVKYTEKGGIKVFVSGEDIDDDNRLLSFRVIDTGIGIPAKKLGVIFESFVQLEDSGRRKYGGTGLGLSITKKLVELQKGDIHVYSNIGKGSEFVFRIPYKVVKHSEAALENRSEHSEKKLTGKNILVVEDNDINQKVILNTLKSWDASCTVVPTAVEGFDMLMKEKYDLILMDIELPVINGWDASQYIRMKFETPKKNIPIIALTAYASEDDKQKCYTSGMNDVVTKPFNNEELFFKMYNLLYGQNHAAEQLKRNADQPESPFEKFEQKYAGDPAGLKEIYELYVAELPGYINELKQFRDADDKTEIKKQVHKMKSPLGMVADETLISCLNRLQTAEVLDNKELREKLIAELIASTEAIHKEISRRLKTL